MARSESRRIRHFPVSRRGSPFIAAVVATRPRWNSLVHVALPTILFQRRLPNVLVIVSDDRAFTPQEAAHLRTVAGRIDLRLIKNRRSPGAAGTWNTGINEVSDHVDDGYVAILDDDDAWDPDHLRCCEVAACAAGMPDIVLSGLRVVRQGVELPRSPLAMVKREDFLAGNPGWQGSNTFVRLSTLRKVGGFTDGLPSTNDRDLAVRLLSIPGIEMAYTGKMTATWHLEACDDALSRRGSPQKRAGLRAFFRTHSHLMTPAVRRQCVERAKQLFDVDLESTEASDGTI